MLNPVDLAWLAGLLEGEGTFISASHRYPVCISLHMTDLDIVQRVADWWGVSISQPRKQQSHYKQTYRCMVRGAAAVTWMKAVLPYMGQRRSLAIHVAIASHQPKGPAQKITASQAGDISRRTLAGESAVRLAEEYGITKWQVYAIKQGRRKIV